MDFMNAYGISGLLTAISSLASGCFVLSKGATQQLTRIWFFVTASVAGWGFGVIWISQKKLAETLQISGPALSCSVSRGECFSKEKDIKLLN